MKDGLEKVNKKGQSLGDANITIGALFSLGSFACPCPICIGAAILFLVNGLRIKLKGLLWK